MRRHQRERGGFQHVRFRLLRNGPQHRFVADDAERTDALVVPIDVMRIDVVIMVVVVIIVVVIIVLGRDCFVLQPALHLDALCLRVEQPEVEQ